MSDRRLPRFPAQENRPPFTQGREVQQTEVEVFHDAAVTLDPVDDADDLGLELGATPGFRAPVGSQSFSAVARSPQGRIVLEQPDRKLSSLAPELLDERRDDRDEGVDFFRRKQLHEDTLGRLVTAFSRFVVVAGLSGAGKSQAMKSFEDLGFYCLDNLPPAMALRLVSLAHEAGVERLALSLDVRTHGPFGEAVAVLGELQARGIDFELLYLDAADDTLVRRYSETRRRHPLDGVGKLADAIARERIELVPLRERATRVWDTSSLTLASLKARIAATYGNDGAATGLAVHIVAFGYKFGVPLDADLMFDVRFLPNPNYVPELKMLSGCDAAVAAYMEALPAAQRFVQILFEMIDFLVPLYQEEGKSRLTLAFGCTGGQHRSVYIAERLAAHLRSNASLSVTLEHRELVPQ